jgi:hypothetical protein
MPVLLLLLFGFALSIGMGFIALVVRRATPAAFPPPLPSSPHERACIFHRPDCWLVVKNRTPAAVQAALGLHNPKRCSWVEGLSDDHTLFISPPVKGWVLVVGLGLPDPSDDIDACFRFVVELSRKLGYVQFFSANRVLHHHAWVQAKSGRVLRAYAWAGRTLWKQGPRTRAEKDLNIKCFDYGEPVEAGPFSSLEAAATNVEKVPLLAERWSFDPARIDERFFDAEQGIAGHLARRY